MSALEDRLFDDKGWTRQHSGYYTGGNNAIVLEAQPTSVGMEVRVGSYGPRGGFRTLASGTIAGLRKQRSILDAAIHYAEEIERERIEWLARKQS